MNLPQETLGLRRPCFSHGSRYSYRHSLFCEVHQCSRSGFYPHTMLLYRCLRIPLLRCRVLAPLHFRRWITRPVSYYALFECVAASKPTSWLSVQSNILSHLTRTWGPLQTIWGVPLLTAELISRGLTPAHHLSGIRSLIGFGRR